VNNGLKCNLEDLQIVTNLNIIKVNNLYYSIHFCGIIEMENKYQSALVTIE